MGREDEVEIADVSRMTEDDRRGGRRRSKLSILLSAVRRQELLA
jgi:hypothetical protein